MLKSTPENDPRYATALAHQALSAGNLPLAWCAASELRRRKIADPAILNMLGLIEVKVGAYAAARAACAEAVKLSPRDPALRQNLAEALDLESRHGPNMLQGQAPAVGLPRIHLIRPWGFGFCADLDHVLGHALMAETQGRMPVVWWGQGSLFCDPGDTNAWTRYFEPVGDLASVRSLLEQRALEPGSVFPSKWTSGAGTNDEVVARLGGQSRNAFAGEGSRLGSPLLVNRAEAVTVGDYFIGPLEAQTWAPKGHWAHGLSIDAVYRTLAARYIRPSKSVQAQVDRAAEQLGLGDVARPVVCVHVREGDKPVEQPELASLNDQAMERVRRLLEADGALRVLLMTDSVHAATRYRSAFGQRVLMLDAIRTASSEGVHTMANTPTAAPAMPSRLGFEVLRDVLLALRCDRFVGVAFSNVAGMISHLRAWPKGACVLLGESLQRQINFLPHIWPG